MWKFDPTDPVALGKMMVENGVDLLSNIGGNPYYIYPQVTRPFDKASYGIPTPEEHPLESMARLFAFTRTVQQDVYKRQKGLCMCRRAARLFPA